MRFGTEAVLVAGDGANYTEEVVEALLDALHDLDAVLEVDAVGSIASRELHLDLEIEAEDMAAAQACMNSIIRAALQRVGGRVVDDGTPKMRARSTAFHEMAV